MIKPDEISSVFLHTSSKVEMRVFYSIFSFFIILVSLARADEELKVCGDGKGHCVEISKCDRKSSPPIEINLADVNKRDECHYLKICCKKEFIIEDSVAKSEIVQLINKEREDQCIQTCRADKVFQHKEILSKFDKTDHKPLEYNCGRSNKDGVAKKWKIIDQNDVAQFAEFPWQLALIQKLDDGLKYLCGASLINPSVAVTSAHCIEGISSEQLIVRAGEWDTQTKNEPFPDENVDVSEVEIHHKYNSSNAYNDVALLFFKTPVNLTVHIDTICLPPKNFKIDEKSECYASGWGVDDFFMDDYFRTNLKKVKLPIIAKPECQERLRATKLGSKFRLHPNFLCAGGEKGVDTCLGDGGGPLFCKMSTDSEIFVQVGELMNYQIKQNSDNKFIGIVSWGIQCGLDGVPGVYADVTNFREWIDTHVMERKFDTKSYTPKS